MTDETSDGGFGRLLDQLRDMQSTIERVEEAMTGRRFEAEAGNGAVRVVVSGKLRVLSVKLDPRVVDANDLEMLEDLVATAVNRALDGIRAEMAREVSGGMFGGGVPGLG